jgi:hypothetical protein
MRNPKRTSATAAADDRRRPRRAHHDLSRCPRTSVDAAIDRSMKA